MQLPFFEIALFWVLGDNLGLKRQLQPQLWYHFVFKVNFEEDLLPQFFFECCLIRSTHPEVSIDEIWNIHWRVFFSSILF